MNARFASHGTAALAGLLSAAAVLCVGCNGDGAGGDQAKADAGQAHDGVIADDGALVGDGSLVGHDGAGSSLHGKWDILWVIDQSASMCQEQRALAAAFRHFAKKIQSIDLFDVQMAVVTSQQAPDKTAIKIIGRFMHTPAKAFPPNCMERVRMYCAVDKTTGKDTCGSTIDFTFPQTNAATMCAKSTIKVGPPKPDNYGKSQGAWRCEAPGDPDSVANVNCSMNSYCQSHCDPKKKNADCEALFGKGALCKVPGGGNNTAEAGCMFPPDTADCPPPDKLPAVLFRDQIGQYGRCNMMVGAAQTPESKFEGPFRAAYMALDRNGPNCVEKACIEHLRRCCVGNKDWCKTDFNKAKCEKEKAELCSGLICQAERLLRSDARLLIVVVSDDDDCSMPMHLNPLDKKVIDKPDWEHCQVLGDELGENVALNEGRCLHLQEKGFAKGQDVYCFEDCRPGSVAKTVAGALKCPGGCKAGTPEASACAKKAAADRPKSKVIDKRFGSVDYWVKKLRSLKDNPDDVHFAAISGDSLAKSAAQRERDLAIYYYAQFRNQAPGQAPYICAGGRGESNAGTRLQAAAKAFGKRGVFYNLCEGQDFGPALTSMFEIPEPGK